MKTSTFCKKCRTQLFDGQNVSPTLPFARPVYDQTRRASTSERLSISGVQTKISLALVEGRLKMVSSGGRYILKPIPRGDFERLNVVPINEHLTMQIARQVFDIDVAANALVHFADGEPAYLTRRFDVQPYGGKWLQEDFAQVAGRTEESHGRNYKYNFSYEEIGSLIRQHVAAYRVDLERFFTLVIFNYLVNNGDAHIKNFSLIQQEGCEHRLTPAYDLLNTRLHLPGEGRTALDLFQGDFTTPSFEANAFYARDDFVEFARRLDLVPQRAVRILDRFVASRDKVVEWIGRSLLPTDCKELYCNHIDDRIQAIGYSYSASRPSTTGQ
jgi:serine/threonine-protein kinase HipA